MFNPFASEKDEKNERISNGISKLYDTSEEEQIAIYEAAMIRYFSPEYNKKFKNSFPSTNLKLLQDCYKKDFSAVFAEFCFDDLPFTLTSETVSGTDYHIAQFDLHNEKERKVFFGINSE